MHNRTVLRAAIYARISKDPTGNLLGVERQQRACHDLCAARSWPVVAVHVDDDLSGFTGRHRPAYEQLVDQVKSGDVDVIVAWHVDRLTRHPRQLEDLIDLLEATNTTVVTVQAGEFDLATAAGRMTARVVGAVARSESETKSERIRAKHVELAERGQIPGGGRRPFGFEADRVTIRLDEAVLVREGADRILAGDSVRSITRDWQVRGVASVTGATWSPTTVRRLLRSARIAGLREHHGHVTATAVWPGIITPDEHRQLRTILDAPDRDRTAGVIARTYLLTGWVYCGRCNVRMTSRATGRRVPRYVCSKDRGGCDRCGISAVGVEELVTGMLLARLDGQRVRARPPRTSSGTTVVEDLEQSLEQLAADHYADGVLSRGEYLAARQAVERRLDAARRRTAQDRRAAVLAPLVEGDVAGVWAGLGIDRQRAVVGAAIDRITVAPCARAANYFDPDRIDVTWRR